MFSFAKGCFWYLAPFAFCKNRHFLRHNGGFPLPYDNLPQTDHERVYGPEEEYQQVWPPDGWKATFGCFACGLVEVYEADDVDDQIVLKASEGVYHSDGV